MSDTCPTCGHTTDLRAHLMEQERLAIGRRLGIRQFEPDHIANRGQPGVHVDAQEWVDYVADQPNAMACILETLHAEGVKHLRNKAMDDEMNEYIRDLRGIPSVDDPDTTPIELYIINKSL